MKKIDYNREFAAVLQTLESKPKLLLHVCCAPCLAGVIGRLEEHFAVTLYYYNPNISPRAEWQKRLDEIKRFLKASNRDFEIITADDADGWQASVKPYERLEGGARCDACCDNRIQKTAEAAKAGGYGYFCTTLSVSPHKKSDGINESMQTAEKRYAVRRLPSDFKKEGGFLASIRECEKYGVYRQSYCGCCPKAYRVAVTGGIASGKSEFVRLLAELGAYTVSADDISRELAAEGGKLNVALKARFPAAVSSQKLDRAALKAIAFADQSERLALNNLTHAAIMREIEKRLSRSVAKIAVCEIPLLFESGIPLCVDTVVTLSSDVSVRERRAQSRDGMTGDLFESIAGTQLTDLQRETAADIVIKNDGDVNNLRSKAEELYQFWLTKN